MTGIGIDLGTTYCCVMHRATSGEDVIVPSSRGGQLTPSIVYFDSDGSVVVGEDAKKMLRSDSDNVVVGIKRHMGKDYPLEFNGTAYTPEAISAIILRRLAMDAATHFNVDQANLRCVITVPAYFGVAEKEATHAAARIAGLNCLELLAEPVAAAYAYGMEPEVKESSLIFDLGGGTFDVAVVGMVDRQPKIWAVDGETQLGGLDWDRRLNDLLWERLTTQGIDEEALYDAEFSSSLLSEAELVKRHLSGHESGTVRVRFAGTSYTVSVTRDSFENATADLVAQCADATRRVIDTAGALGADNVSRILLVGGSTRMPMLRRALERQLRLPTLIHDPDKAVARGAAILASKLTVPGGMSTARDGTAQRAGIAKRITPVLPKAIGIKIYSSGDPMRPDPYILNILPANTPLPVMARRVTVATIMAHQSSARIELYEQAGAALSEDLDANRILYDGEVTGIPPAPAGSPITFTLSVEVDGRISVTAADGASGAALQLDAFIHGVIDEQELSEQAANVSSLIMAS